MKRQVKFTQEQIKSMLDYVSTKEKGNGKQDLQFLYNLNTPDKVYIKYTSYRVTNDNSISSELQIICVGADGGTSNCYDQFNDLNEQMAFASDFIEIDIDSNGKMEIK